MKANYQKKINQKELEEQAYAGFQFALNLITVALNEELGLGGKRLERVRIKVNELYNEYFTGEALKDEQSAYQLTRRVNQIMGE